MRSGFEGAGTGDGHRLDVLVIGGGPAGCAVSTLLARAGRSVALVEKERHPRFHIGESLLPANVALLERLGVREAVERIGMPKWGVEFASPEHRHRCFVEFADAWDKSMPMAWQVRRSEFDEILFRHAAACGVQTIEGCRVQSVDFSDPDSVRARALLDDGATREFRARLVIDASGRDTLLANQFRSKSRNERHNSAALFGHFTGARRLPGRQEGNISIFWFRHGWFWFIPLADGTTSVGAVCWPQYLKTRDKPLREFFADTIAMCPALAERLATATLVDDRVHATGNYAYSSDHCAGDRYLMIGDAFAFIDPVFSSGVYLAMSNAFAAADTAAVMLDQPLASAAARRRFERHMRHGPQEFSWFIYRMTNPAMRDLFMHPRNVLRAKEAVLALLAGDIYGGSPIRASLTFFKAIYYLTSAVGLKRTWAAWRARRAHLRELDHPDESDRMMRSSA